MSYDAIPFDTLIGKTIVQVNSEPGEHPERVTFTMKDGPSYYLEHQQDCCENVYLEDVDADWSTLVGEPIVAAEVSTDEKEAKYGYHQTWTFYRLATKKGHIVMRWCGESNGYYSESVDLYVDGGLSE